MSTPSTMRRIVHLDMDAFYASVELLRFPQLAAQPVVIGGSQTAYDTKLLTEYAGRLHTIPLQRFMRLNTYVGRGVITTATYTARAFGLGSAMGLMKAAKLCPHAILLPANFDAYRRYSIAFKQVAATIATTIEDRGIDEIYIDLGDLLQNASDGGLALAQRLQNAVFQKTKLSCSIGVAPNKLLAKMASEMQKPHGISILFAADVQEKIWPLPVRKIYGVGPKTEAKLHSAKLHIIGDIAASDPIALQMQFGQSYGKWLFEASHGKDDRPVQTHSDPVSFSRETTFEKDMHALFNKARLGATLSALCQDLTVKLQRKGLTSGCVGIKIRYTNFQTVTCDLALTNPSNNAEVIRRQAGLCLKKVDLTRHFRLLGVKVSKLRSTRKNPAALPKQQNLGLFPS